MRDRHTRTLQYWAPLLACLIGPLGVQTAGAAESKPYAQSATLEITATISSVDPQRRTIGLTGPDGEHQQFDVGPEVHNLNAIKPGDQVKITYHIGVVAEIKPPGTPAQAPSLAEHAQTGPASGKPSASASRTISTTVQIQSVDPATHTVTFKRADGTVDTLEVKDSKAQQRVSTLKPGDAVQMTYTEAMAVKVQPAMR